MDFRDEYREFFESKVLIYYDYLHGFLLTATGDYCLAGDILQETMAKAWEKVDLIKEYSNIKYALRTIARNTLYNYYKKRGSRNELFFHGELEKFVHTERDNLMCLLQDEGRRTVLDAIGKLKKPHMQVILLRYYYDQSFRDVARLTNTNYNTVLSHHRRAICKLREILLHRA